MFKIEYGKIFITRGDSAAFDIQVRQPDKRTIYELSDGDVLTFTVKASDTEIEYLLQKTGQTIHIDPVDTQKLAYGRYLYDVQLMQEFVLNHTRIDKKEFSKKKAKDWYLNAAEQIEKGVVDEILDDLSKVM